MLVVGVCRLWVDEVVCEGGEAVGGGPLLVVRYPLRAYEGEG